MLFLYVTIPVAFHICTLSSKEGLLSDKMPFIWLQIWNIEPLAGRNDFDYVGVYLIYHRPLFVLKFE